MLAQPLVAAVPHVMSPVPKAFSGLPNGMGVTYSPVATRVAFGALITTLVKYWGMASSLMLTLSRRTDAASLLTVTWIPLTPSVKPFAVATLRATVSALAKSPGM